MEEENRKKAEQDEKEKGKHFDRVNQRKNCIRKMANIGATGKYYCGQNIGTCADCCNNQCGPDSGCNCIACMQLDIAARMLPKGFYVNSEGRACRFSQFSH